jgi:O-acetyl-ADP-ribose deacetylase
VWRGGSSGEPELLASCHRRSLEVAEELGAARVAFPAISTGVYGYPVSQAAEVALDAVASFDARVVREVVFVLFSAEALDVFSAAWSRRST